MDKAGLVTWERSDPKCCEHGKYGRHVHSLGIFLSQDVFRDVYVLVLLHGQASQGQDQRLKDCAPSSIFLAHLEIRKMCLEMGKRASCTWTTCSWALTCWHHWPVLQASQGQDRRLKGCAPFPISRHIGKKDAMCREMGKGARCTWTTCSWAPTCCASRWERMTPDPTRWERKTQRV